MRQAWHPSYHRGDSVRDLVPKLWHGDKWRKTAWVGPVLSVPTCLQMGAQGSGKPTVGILACSQMAHQARPARAGPRLQNHPFALLLSKVSPLLLRRRDGTTLPGHICHVRLGSKRSFPLSGPQCFPRDGRDTENLKEIRRLSETPTWSQKANLETEARPQGGESRRCKTKSPGCV